MQLGTSFLSVVMSPGFREVHLSPLQERAAGLTARVRVELTSVIVAHTDTILYTQFPLLSQWIKAGNS